MTVSKILAFADLKVFHAGQAVIFGSAEMFWSIFLVVSQTGIYGLEETHIPIASFNDRASCENAIKSRSEIILYFEETNVTIGCLRTDEKVDFELIDKSEED